MKKTKLHTLIYCVHLACCSHLSCWNRKWKTFATSIEPAASLHICAVPDQALNYLLTNSYFKAFVLIIPNNDNRQFQKWKLDMSIFFQPPILKLSIINFGDIKMRIWWSANRIENNSQLLDYLVAKLITCGSCRWARY